MYLLCAIDSQDATLKTAINAESCSCDIETLESASIEIKSLTPDARQLWELSLCSDPVTDALIEI